MILIISGKRGVGKDTIAEVLAEGLNFTHCSLATAMKLFLFENGVFSRQQLFGPSACREEIDPRWGKSARQALQSLGTEWGRTFHEDLWVNILLRDIEKNGDENVVISDIRFPNELAAFKAAGALAIRVVRPQVPWASSYDIVLSQHASETALDGVPDREFDRVIINNGTLEELKAQARLLARGTR